MRTCTRGRWSPQNRDALGFARPSNKARPLLGFSMSDLRSPGPGPERPVPAAAVNTWARGFATRRTRTQTSNPMSAPPAQTEGAVCPLTRQVDWTVAPKAVCGNVSAGNALVGRITSECPVTPEQSIPPVGRAPRRERVQKPIPKRTGGRSPVHCWRLLSRVQLRNCLAESLLHCRSSVCSGLQHGLAFVVPNGEVSTIFGK